MILSEYKEIVKFAMQNEIEAKKFYKMENAFVDIGYPEVW